MEKPKYDSTEEELCRDMFDLFCAEFSIEGEERENLFLAWCVAHMGGWNRGCHIGLRKGAKANADGNA